MVPALDCVPGGQLVLFVAAPAQPHPQKCERTQHDHRSRSTGWVVIEHAWISLRRRASEMKRGLTVRMVLASGLLAIIIGGAFATRLVAITDLRQANDHQRDTREELVAAEALESVVIDLETGLRGFVITGKDRFLDPATTARASFPEKLKALEQLAAEDPEDRVAREEVRRIGQAARLYIREYALPLTRAVRRNDPSARSVE